MIGSNSARLTSVALLFVVLGTGFLMGMAWDTQGVVSAASVETVETPEEPERRRLVIDDVGLEPERRIQVDLVIEHFQGRMDALNAEFQEAYAPKRRELYRETRDSIKALLTEEQVDTYERLLEKRWAERNQEQEDENDGSEQDGGGS